MPEADDALAHSASRRGPAGNAPIRGSRPSARRAVRRRGRAENQIGRRPCRHRPWQRTAGSDTQRKPACRRASATSIPAMRIGRAGRKSADRFEGRLAIERGRDVGPAKLVQIFAGLDNVSSLADSAHDPSARYRQARGDDSLAILGVEQTWRRRPPLEDHGSGAARHRPSRRDFHAAGQHMDHRRTGWPTGPDSGIRPVPPFAGP